MANRARSDQRKENEVILLSLELVNGSDLHKTQLLANERNASSIYLVWASDERVACAAALDDISQQMLLSIVSCEHRDLFRWISEKSHVHECGNN